MISFRFKSAIRESTLDRWGAEGQLLGAGSTIAVSISPLTRITTVALKDERVLPDPGLFQAGLLQPGKQPLSARSNERQLLFVFCQVRCLANDQERGAQFTAEDRRRSGCFGACCFIDQGVSGVD